MFNDVDIIHKDGVPWWEAPRPNRFHRCQPQTSGWIGLRPIERCACGAIRSTSRWWRERNSRKRVTP